MTEIIIYAIWPMVKNYFLIGVLFIFFFYFLEKLSMEKPNFNRIDYLVVFFFWPVFIKPLLNIK
jgi:hypothetical protein